MTPQDPHSPPKNRDTEPPQTTTEAPQPQVAELLADGLSHHQAGHLSEAEARYRRVLEVVPGHADALYLLGLVAYQFGRYAAALEWINQAIQQNGSSPAYHTSRGLALHGLKRLDEAVAAHDRALALQPHYAEALLNRGLVLEEIGHLGASLESYDRALALRPDYPEALNNRGNTLQALRRFNEALESYDRATALRPDLAEAYYNRGDTLRELGRPDEAATSYDRALALKPDLPMIYCARGDAARNLGQFDDAVAQYDRALALKPDFPEALLNRGLVFEQQELFAQALESYDRALAVKPDYGLALHNRGNVLRQFKRFEEALECYDRALAIKPDYAEALNNRGITSEVLKRLDDALASYDRALAVKPDYAEALNNRGNALDQMQRFGEAVDSYNRAIAAKADLAEAHYNLGTVLQSQGEVKEAVAAFGRAAALRPNYGVIEWFNAKQTICDWSGYEEAEAKVREVIKIAPSAAAPLLALAVSSTPKEQYDCAHRVAEMMAVADSDVLPSPKPRPGERIRLGYLSYDFRQHAGAVLIAPLIEHHDHRRFEVIGYSYGPDDASAMRARFIAAFDRFVDIGSLSHRQAAELIHADGIDILVDLTGYQGYVRTDHLTHILAYRPAPIQVNYFGYPGTMGADFIDYIIVDPFIAPMDQQPFYTERLVQLPHCYQPNDAARRIAETLPSRAEWGLPQEGFVFCCFNSSHKIAPALFDIWMRLLKAVPGSVLWLIQRNAIVQDNLRREAIRRGVQAERLVFAPSAPLPEHLARHAVADLFLDTLPYNAHTTASDALLAGLPILTCAGATFAGRVAGSLMQTAGLDELVTTSLEDYEALALRLATQPDQLRELRQRLADSRSTTPLFDIALFTRDLEAAYENMWEMWQAGQPPAAFSLASLAETEEDGTGPSA